MKQLPLEPRRGGGRFPDFDVMAHAGNWDAATRAVVTDRLDAPAEARFFTETEMATATAMFDQLLYQRQEPRVPVAGRVDKRLADGQTDGWHYETMPIDAVTWRDSLAGLDSDAQDQCGTPFAACSWEDQALILQAIQDLGAKPWHGFVAEHVWGLWTRYACTAFYAHPAAWNEIGFDGPAYPRGYKNLGVDRLEGFEVRDARPSDDPLADGR
ncbi:gluconate 2-dehydrogenase subunit 3 family protein [Paeniglutamicibacter antarcticus]|uniref:Gluconate 2-dehydrogenase subunit 3 family protein n=1 Tax=Paeniglutamicibacter antarcticus TaxID=494023 RepID=A0ABP9TKG2_9MICC